MRDNYLKLKGYYKGNYKRNCVHAQFYQNLIKIHHFYRLVLQTLYTDGYLLDFRPLDLSTMYDVEK